MLKPWKHFTVKEALWLPSWNRAATAADGLTLAVEAQLDSLFHVMDTIREMLGSPISVHCAYRPLAYNKLVGGVPASAHLFGQACDFSVKGMTCDEVRAKLLPYLDFLQIRMENLPGSCWVHIDTRAPGVGGRYFTP
jgi:uncharacterized protein YcbK (DUF882 family)